MSKKHIDNTEGQKRKNNDDIPRSRDKCIRKKKEKRQLQKDRLEFFEKQGCVAVSGSSDSLANVVASSGDNICAYENLQTGDGVNINVNINLQADASADVNHDFDGEYDTGDDDHDSIDLSIRHELNLATGSIEAIPELFEPVFQNIGNNYGPDFVVFFENKKILPQSLCQYAEECADAWEQLTDAHDLFRKKTQLLADSFQNFEAKL